MASIHRHKTKAGESRYVVRYRDPTRRLQQETFRRAVDAQRFRSEVESAMYGGTYIDRSLGATTFDTYADLWLASRSALASTTLDRDRSYLNAQIRPTFGSRSVGSIASSEIETWLGNLDLAGATKAKLLQIVRGVLALARRDRAIPFNPATDIRPPSAEPARVGRALSDDEIAAILRAADDIDETTAGIVWLMVRAGLRIGEAFAVQRSDIELDSGILQVQRSLNRRGEVTALKGRKRTDQGRTIKMPADLIRRLRRHLDESTIASLDGWVFTAPRGGLLRYTAWRSRLWKSITKQAGVDARPHDLRHTAITRLIRVDGWSPSQAQHFAGHRDPRMTLKVYTHITADDLPAPSELIAV